MTGVFALLLIGVSSAGSSQQYDVAAPQWTFKYMKELKQAGFGQGFRENFCRPRATTRYEFAFAIHVSMRVMREILNRTPDDKAFIPNPYDRDVPPFEMALIGAEISRLLPALIRCTREFTKELTSLGVDVPQMRQELNELSREVDDLWSPATMATWATSPNP